MNAQTLVGLAAARGWTIGVAESLTGGLVTAAMVEVPGASRVVRGGVVAYATELKGTLLGVDHGLLAERGAVDPDVAAAMARGVREATGADVGLATTGVAGPDPQDGVPPGLVYVAAETPAGSSVRRIEVDGERAVVRDAAVAAVLALAEEVVGGEGSVSGGR